VNDLTDFRIHCTRFLDATGKPVADLPPIASDPAALLELYRGMLFTRAFDKKAIALQRTGQLGTYASCLGQEAIGVGLGHAMRPEDVLFPYYRDYAAQFQRGVTMAEILVYWGGDERGMDYAGCREDFPICVPIASQCCHAIGVAYAFKLRREARVAVCTIGDGGTSKGDFYEALNAAGVWQLPIVFVVNNNQWAISVPREQQSAAQTLAQKAVAAGFCGEQVDGNDVIAVRQVVGRALEATRAGEGPQLIECLSYRLGDHTTADDASRYRSPAEVEAHAAYDPLIRLHKYLIYNGFLNDIDEAALTQAAAKAVELAVKDYLQTPAPAPEAMFDHLYAQLPAAYQEQRAEVARGIEQTQEASYAAAHAR
jgi:pyruvate dehydrogenase E1 component alpha subunit